MFKKRHNSKLHSLTISAQTTLTCRTVTCMLRHSYVYTNWAIAPATATLYRAPAELASPLPVENPLTSGLNCLKISTKIIMRLQLIRLQAFVVIWHWNIMQQPILKCILCHEVTQWQVATTFLKYFCHLWFKTNDGLSRCIIQTAVSN